MAECMREAADGSGASGEVGDLMKALQEKKEKCEAKCEVKTAVAQKSENYSLAEVKPTDEEKGKCMAECMREAAEGAGAGGEVGDLMKALQEKKEKCEAKCEVKTAVALAEVKPTD